MKPLAILFLAALLSACQPTAAQSSVTPIGQQVTPVNPAIEAPAVVTTRFAAEYPNTPASWKMAGDLYVAECQEAASQRKKLIAYDNFGNYQYSRTELASNQIPKPLSKYLKANYPDSTASVWKHEDKDKQVYFLSPFKSDTLRFDEQGRLKK